MGKIVLARVDERLIHGQVMTQISKKSGANAIFVVDDATANDDFLKQVFLSSGSRTGQEIKIFTEADAAKYWEDSKFDNYNVILLAKTVKTFSQLAKAGVKFDGLNLGALSKRPGTTSVIKTVSITKEDLALLIDLRDNFGVEVYFQSIPSTKSTSLKEAEKIVG